MKLKLTHSSESFMKHIVTRFTYVMDSDILNFRPAWYFLTAWNCTLLWLLLNSPENTNELNDGNIFFIVLFSPFLISESQYYFQTYTFTCFDGESYEESAKFKYYPYGLLISCVFLALTLFVYSSIPKVFIQLRRKYLTKNVHWYHYSSLTVTESAWKNSRLLCHFILSSLHNIIYRSIQTETILLLLRSGWV